MHFDHGAGLATSPIGYATGAGGTVIQQTSKSTGVTLNTLCGEITMNAASLSAGTTVSFTLANNQIGAHDVIALNLVSGYANMVYFMDAAVTSAGSAVINVRNNGAGPLLEALVIRFAIIKAAAS